MKITYLLPSPLLGKQCKANTYELIVKTFACEGRNSSPPMLTDSEYQQLTAARAKQLGKHNFFNHTLN